MQPPKITRISNDKEHDVLDVTGVSPINEQFSQYLEAIRQNDESKVQLLKDKILELLHLYGYCE